MNGTIGLALDREENPANIMQLEDCENVRLTCHSLLDVASVFVEHFLPAGDNLRQDRKPIAGRRLGKDRAIAALLRLVLFNAAFRNRLCRRFGPILYRCV